MRGLEMGQRRLDEAIAECKRAIACDPGFGNPYNDIGVYVMEMGRRGDPVARAPRRTHQSRDVLRSGDTPRNNLAKLWDEVEDSRTAAVIQRRGHEAMALIG
ncbi:MAG: hypothetical protein HY705_08170 [Gemmatimonadetes bacterium]|nr:hypothetical protein [Gemmatimonadota bacterium]